MDNLSQYYGFFYFVLGSFIFCFLMLFLGFFLGGISENNKNKNVPFESGIVSFNLNKLRFPIKFALIGILFVIFDVEALYLYTWSVSVIENGWVGFCEAIFIIFTLLIILFYLLKKRILN